MACRNQLLSLEAALRFPHLSEARRCCAFVVGPFKSGTSLLASKLERHGFFNPAVHQTHIERAYGRRVRRYPTREARAVRSLNERLLSFCSGRPIPDRVVPAVPGRLLIEAAMFLESLPDIAVIKDPLLCSTLLVWTTAARTIGTTPFVFFVVRPFGSLMASWHSAPFTRFLIRESPDLPSRMVANAAVLLRCAVESGIAVCMTDFDHLLGVAPQSGTPMAIEAE
jgi:hypothetical protein